MVKGSQARVYSHGISTTLLHFRVEWRGTLLAFSEVTGLNIEVQPTGYRLGPTPDKMVRGTWGGAPL